jgi:hypothetical protein
MDLEMVTPARPKIDNQRRRGAALLARLPLQLQLPDLSPPQEPRSQPDGVAGSITAGSPASTPAGESGQADSVATARTEISQRRYEDGHRQVTRLIDRMRDRRRRWFDRLWVASIVLTTMSIGALVFELYQNLSEPQSAVETAATHDGARPANLKSRKSAERSGKEVVPANSEDPADEMVETADGEKPVNSAMYTTTESGEPQGAWLTGKINDGEENSVPENSVPENSVPEDSVQEDGDQPSETANQ